MKKTEEYHIISKIFHWVMAVLIIGQLIGAIFMVYFADSESFISKFGLYSLHKSFGVTILALALLRLINRYINKPPAIPTTINKIERTLARSGHHIMYILMFLIPISGYLMSNSFGYSVKLFTIDLPDLVNRNFEIAAIFKSLHYYLGYLLLITITLHILATIRHRFFDKKENNILKRMT